jgi:branched-chain amino acid aminotransferase
MVAVGDPRVRAYEAKDAGLRPLGGYPSLAASAADLPQGAYSTLRTYGGRGVVRLEQHRLRLEDSAARQGREGRIEPAVLRQSLASALDATRYEESRLRLTFAPPRLFVAIEPFSPLPRRRYEEGVAAVTLELRRENPRAKDTRFIATAQGAYESLPPDVEEGLIVAPDGSVLEGLSSNFFAVRNGVLFTEEERVLAGVTRSLVLEVAAGRLPLTRTAVRRDELGELEEAFITSVSREVLPVVRIDDRPIGRGRVGEVARAVMAAFADLVAREKEEL